MPAAHTIRSITSADLPEWAALVARAEPQEWVDFEPDTPATIASFDQSLARAGSQVQRIVALQQSQIAGVATYFQVPWTRRQQHYWSIIRVDPPFRRQGIGHALWNHVVAQVQACGGRSLAIETRVDATQTIAACKRAGLIEAFRSIECIADPRQFDATPFMAAFEKTAAAGISIEALPTLQQRDPDWLAKLHALYATLSIDVPIPERATMLPEELADFVGNQPTALPEACFVAIATDGSYAGVSFMHRSTSAPILYQKLTGVLAAYRGRSIALTLKLHTMAYAQRHGYHQIITWIESNNPAMLSLSDRLGFVQQPGGIMVLERAIN